MIVELVGLPGVGKTYLCRSLEEHYAGRNDARVHVIVETEYATFGILGVVLEKLWRAARFAATHPGTTGKLLLAIRPKTRILSGGPLSKLVNLLAETDRSARISPSETWISEQGVLQAVWSLEMRSDESVRAELLEALSRWLPERVVFVETDRAEYESRLKRRKGGRSHFDRLNDGGLPEAIERGSRRTHEILDVWALHVPDGDRLDFWNGRDARVMDIVEWIGEAGAVRPSASLRVHGDRVV